MSSRRRLYRSNQPPSYTERKPLPLDEIPVPPALARDCLMPGINAYLRLYRLGECTVIVTREYQKWHLSIAHTRRYPHWDEIAEARYRILPDALHMALILPPQAEYLNINPNCFQLVEIANPDRFPTQGAE